MKMTHSFLPKFIGLIAGATIACGTALAADDVINSTDKSFLQSAYEDGLAEIHMAGLGVKKTGNPDIKAFAEKLEADHGQANGEMKQLAENKKVSVASSPDLLDKGKKMMMDMKTDNFDKDFIDAMVKDHQKAIAAFEKAANESTDPDVKAFAAKTLPTLREHLAMAQQIQEKIGK